MGDIVYAQSFTPSGTPADLTGFSVVPGTTQGSWALNTDTTQGTVYLMVLPQGASTPTAGDIVAGTNAVGPAVALAAGGASLAGTFTGLTAGTAYTAYAVQRIDGVDSDVETFNFSTSAAGTASVSIFTMQESGHAAPAGATFEARVSGFDTPEDLNPNNYDRSFHRLRYRWTVQVQGQAYVARPSDKVVNLPAAHNDTNMGYGKRFPHVFTEPGNYTITCEVRDNSGAIASTSITYTVADPNIVFAGNRTILVGPADPTYPGAQVVSTLSAATSALNGLGQTGRILIARGSTYADGGLQFSSGADNVYIGSYGSGLYPVIGEPGQHAVRINGSFGGDVQLEDLIMLGGWDSTAESGNNGGNGVRTFTTNTPQRYVLNNCTASGWGEGIKAPGADNPAIEHASYVHNCDASGNRFYAGIGIVPLSTGSFYAGTGCYLGSQIEDMMGGPKDGNYNNHGSIRSAATKYFHLAVCDMFTRCGWNPTTGIPTAKGPFIQSCVRVNTSNRQGMSAIIERCAMEAGISMSAGGARSYGINWLTDKCLFVGHSGTSDMGNIESPGMTIRNCICVHPNAPTSTSTGRRMFQGGPQNGTPQYDPTWPVEIYSNTFVFLMDGVNFTQPQLFAVDLSDGGGFQNLVNDNNITDIPNHSGFSGDVGLNLTQNRMPTAGGLHEPRWAGVKYRASSAVNGQQLTMNAAYASPANTVKDFYPGPGSTARASASGVCAIDDFFGNIRPVAVASRAKGALEPA
ncbi:MAG: hypothetical protein AAGK37_19410 [Pseudomonadota bacterium]